MMHFWAFESNNLTYLWFNCYSFNNRFAATNSLIALALLRAITGFNGLRHDNGIDHRLHFDAGQVAERHFPVAHLDLADQPDRDLGRRVDVHRD